MSALLTATSRASWLMLCGVTARASRWIDLVPTQLAGNRTKPTCRVCCDGAASTGIRKLARGRDCNGRRLKSTELHRSLSKQWSVSSMAHGKTSELSLFVSRLTSPLAPSTLRIQVFNAS